jgi:hypothetical protein
MTNLGSRYRKEEKSGGSAWTQTDGQGAWTTVARVDAAWTGGC